MQTPISFILDLILDYELPADAQKACRKYVRELEKNMSVAPRITSFTPPLRPTIEQSPSTLALMAKHELTAPITAPIQARIVGGEVSTGNGTRGPKKW